MQNESGADTVIGHYWKVNRSSIKYREISPYVIDALISTEDERFMGILVLTLERWCALPPHLESQVEHLLLPNSWLNSFSPYKKEKKSNEGDGKSKGVGTLGRINEKAQEHIIAAVLKSASRKKKS